MERIKLWAQAAAADMRDAEHLADVACQMKRLGDSAAAREFASRAKTHLGYVDEANDEINKLLKAIPRDGTEPEAEASMLKLRLSILEEERDAHIANITARLESL